jgi:two-component system sensor histidine kinase/response regulator
MGGRIWVESELGKGSLFTFTARFDRQPLQQERKFVPPSDIQGLKVLVVDDCSETRTIMQKMLESFGLHVGLVASGMESLNTLKQSQDMAEPFELVIIDWFMPGLDGIETARKIRRELKLSIPIILMTAFGKEPEGLDIKKDGISGFLTKPIYQSMLFNAIMDAFGKEQLKKVGKEEAIITSASIYKKRLKGIQVLVAEDNPTNQEIALAILEGAGMVVAVVKNGSEAVKAFQGGGFDAILMDIQMPEMDGYEATRMIRRREEESGIVRRTERIPIIAMTAHAMKGDEEKCLEAGMDAYVSKPINQNRLFRTLWHSLESHRISMQQDIEPEASTDEKQSEEGTNGLPAELPGIKISKALKALNIDGNIFKTILINFLENNKDTMSKIRSAFGNEDWESLMHLSHSLKGSAGNIGADELYRTGMDLEMASTSREASVKPPALSLVDALDASLNKVLTSLETLVDAGESKALHVGGESLDMSRLEQELKQLADALKTADPEAITRQMGKVREHADNSILQKLESQINNYDYDEAIETINRILKIEN